MAKINDGGPAFPTAEHGKAKDPHRKVIDLGMSLRDWFAGRALMEMLASEAFRYLVADEAEIRRRAEAAYTLADAMIEQRKKGADDDGGNGGSEGGRTSEGDD